MRYFILLFLFIWALLPVNAQTDTKFWFAAPDISHVHGPNPKNGAPIKLHITAVYATHVKVSMPANPSFTYEFDLSAQEHRTILLEDTLDIDEIETYPTDPADPNFIQNKGFLIEASPGEVTAYYELDNEKNRDIFALKGKNSLGTDFVLSTQNYWDNGNKDDDYKSTVYSGFVVVATEDNTTVTVYQNSEWLHFPFSSPPSMPRVVTLNKGETFAIRAKERYADNHPMGVRVTSDKDIAITLYDDSMGMKSVRCRDTFGDQTIPVDITGQEYIVVKGFLYIGYEDHFFVTAIKDGTQIYVDDVFIATLDAGESYYQQMTAKTHKIYGSKNIYVNHISGFGCELGGAVLPAIDNCTGSYSVTFTRTPNTNDAFYLNIMVRNDTIDGSPLKNQSVKNFKLHVGGNTYDVPEDHFEFIQDSAFAILKGDDQNSIFQKYFSDKITHGSEARVSNDVSKFHLGVINGGEKTGCKYGYFSDYGSSASESGIGGAYNSSQSVFCNMDPFRLVATGGTTYNWSGVHTGEDEDVTDYITNTKIADPYFTPPYEGEYNFTVDITGECVPPRTDTLIAYVYIVPQANFDLSDIEGCSPFKPMIRNLTDTTISKPETIEWYFGDKQNLVLQDSLPSWNFEYPFPENKSDSVEYHDITLKTSAENNLCANDITRTVSIKPEVRSVLSAAGQDTIGCHPLTVQFDNQSVGYGLDSNSFFWDFGNYSQSIDSIPEPKVFTNYSLNDTTFIAKLIAESPFNCFDTSYQNIIVHPRVDAEMSIDKGSGCSPLEFTIDPKQSIGVDSFYWDIDYWYADSSFLSETKNEITLTHRDSTVIEGPDTIKVNLIGANRFACRDTFPERLVVVYPDALAKLDIDKDTICDGDSVEFTNKSFGYNLDYYWDFDDGNTSLDSAISEPRPFYNRVGDGNNIEYNVSLQVISDNYFCQNKMDTNIVVHPYINADFSIDYESSCAPVPVTFSDASTGVDSSIWDFGDGEKYTDTDGIEPGLKIYKSTGTVEDTTYNIKLGVWNNYGCTDSIVRKLPVYPEVVSKFSLENTIGCSPLNVGVFNESEPKNGNLSYSWDFGNSTTSSKKDASFMKEFTNYTQRDTTYTVILTATNASGCDSTTIDSVTVYAEVDANFVVPNPEGCSPLQVKVENNSSAGAQVFEWTLNDKDSLIKYPSKRVPTILPLYDTVGSEPKSFFLKLKAYNMNDSAHKECADVHEQELVVFPKVTAQFSFEDSICYPAKTEFTNFSFVGDNPRYVWNFGDGSGSSAKKPTHSFNNFYTSRDTSYTVSLTAYSKYNCSDDTSQTITIHAKPQADFIFTDSAIGCPPFVAYINNFSEGSNLSYYWDLAEEGTSNSKNPIDTFYNYSSTIAEKNIQLVVTSDKGCIDQVEKPLRIFPYVDADFEMSDTAGCNPTLVNFTGDTVNSNRLLWYVDGSVFSTIGNPSYSFAGEYPENDTFNIKFEAWSNYNCFADTTKQFVLYPSPNAEFSPDPIAQEYDTTKDATVVSYFNETPFFDVWKYEWDYGDGIIDNQIEQSFEHLYGDRVWGDINNNNQIPVTLRAWNKDNPECNDKKTHDIVIHPPLPIVDIGEDIEGCMPFTIDFTPYTKYNYEDMFEWSFGNGDSTHIEFPSYTFREPGVYKVKLKVRGDGGKNFSYKDIVVYPKPLIDFTFNDSLLYDSSQTKGYEWVKFHNSTKFGESYRWYKDDEKLFEDFDGMGDDYASREENPRWYYDNIGTYNPTLVATSEFGCKDTLIHPTPINVVGRGYLEMPTGFFVRGNNRPEDPYATDRKEGNRYLFYPANDGIESYKLEIYNRWGVLLFTSDDVNKGWNGYVDGRPAAQDVYIWRAKGYFTNGQAYNKSGDVTLLRDIDDYE